MDKKGYLFCPRVYNPAEKGAAMKISVRTPPKGRVGTLVVFVQGKELLGPWKQLAPGVDKRIEAHAKLENFKGKPDQVLTLYPGDGIERVIAVGVDGKPEWGFEYLRRAAANAHARAKAVAAESVAVVVPEGTAARAPAQAVTEGFRLAAYSFDKYKNNDDKPKRVEEVSLVVQDEAGARKGVDAGQVFSDATCVTRDLVNEHASYMTPRRLAEAAGHACKGLDVKVHDEKWIEKQGMNALRAVSLGSEEPPRFVHISYKSPGAKKSIALVGKGITFDSGGLCIKTAEGMMEMKCDMAGAASVIGIMSALPRLKPKVNVHGIFGATENMPGGGAYKMRDVLRAMNGKTMEITNTDAEGRVILSDALSYASTLKPDAIVDMATLTGAVVVALGPKYSGVMGTDQKLIDSLLDSAKRAGERFWQLPLEQEYFEDSIKSDVADMKNSGGRGGGAIVGGLFLQQFVDPKIPWAHIDIAGPAIFSGGKHYQPAGASGVPVRSILRYLEEL
jgi:leucyl aminopeptidase